MFFFFREKCAKEGIDPTLILMWAMIGGETSFLAYSVDEYLTDSDERLFRKPTSSLPLLEVVNGSSVLPHTILRKLNKFKEFNIHTGSPVFKIDNTDEKKITVYHGKCGSGEKVIEGDLVFIATTAKAVGLIEFMKPLPYMKTVALGKACQKISFVRLAQGEGGDGSVIQEFFFAVFAFLIFYV